MGLLDDLPTTKAATAEAIYDALEEKFVLPEGLTEAQIDAIKANWQKVAEAVAEHLQPTMQHIIDHGVEQAVIDERDVVKRSGFVYPDLVTVVYDSSARTVSIGMVGFPIDVMSDGIRYELETTLESGPHTDAAGSYYLVMTVDEAGVPTLTWKTTPWTFQEIWIAKVTYNGAVSSSTWCQRECHGTLAYQAHKVLHDMIGTYRDSGGTLTAGTYQINPASPVDADNRPGVDETYVQDEDLITRLVALLENGPYTTLHFTGAGIPSFDTAAVDIYRKPAGNYIHYNPYNGVSFSEVQGATLRYYNVYLIATPASGDITSQRHRYWWLQPQAEFTSSAAAAAEDFRSLYLGTLTAMASEFVAVSRVTFVTGASYGTVGKCRIHAVSVLSGSRATQVVSSGGTIPSHNTLQDRDAAAAHPATALTYDNTTSGLEATTVQEAIDELAGSTGGGGPQRIVLAANVIAPAGVTYSGGASSPPASASCTLRIVLCKAGLGTAYGQLWDLTADAEVSVSNTTNQAPTVFDSTVAITADHLYEVRVWTTGAGQSDVAILGSAQLIVE